MSDTITRQIAIKVFNLRHEFLKQGGTQQQLFILLALHHCGGSMLVDDLRKEFATDTSKKPSIIAANCVRLSEAGWVTYTHTDERRKQGRPRKIVTLTPKAENLLAMLR